MKLLITALLTLIPLMASAESRGGVTVGPSTVPYTDGTIPFGLHGADIQIIAPHFPHVRSLHRSGIRPLIGFPMTPNLTIVNVQVERPEEPPPPPPKPPAPAKFWIARCGSFVELQVSPTMNLMEEEQKGCPN